MPIFEYKCSDCEKEFEELVISDRTSVNCPSCGSGRIEKLFSAFSGGSSAGGNPSGSQSGGGCGSFG
ncbi:MAG: zinc ribbon domain-containing protein [Candidatus Krumholzibacteriota bacterium]|nr:zinc ribbon domain-containing protein [Candidatus Krumholzibacteriota bacterium]